MGVRWGPGKPYRIYPEAGRAAGPRWDLLEAWGEACRVEQLAADRGHELRRIMAAVARVACEQAMLDARRN